MTQLDPHARQLVDLAREISGPSAEQLARTKLGLSAKLAASASAGAVATATSTTPSVAIGTALAMSSMSTPIVATGTAALSLKTLALALVSTMAVGGIAAWALASVQDAPREIVVERALAPIPAARPSNELSPSVETDRSAPARLPAHSAEERVTLAPPTLPVSAIPTTASSPSTPARPQTSPLAPGQDFEKPREDRAGEPPEASARPDEAPTGSAPDEATDDGAIEYARRDVELFPRGEAVARTSAAQDSELQRELRELEPALNDIRREEWAAALIVLDRFHSRFPNATLSAEAGVLEVRTLCALRRADDARVLTSALTAKFPDVPAIQTLRESCGITNSPREVTDDVKPGH